MRRVIQHVAGAVAVVVTSSLFVASPALAGAQQYEPLAASVRSALSKSVADSRPIVSSFKSPMEAIDWLSQQSPRLSKKIPDSQYRLDLLRAIHYEATRAGLDPQMVLGLVQVESGFRKYAVSSAGARGYMQVMPFWIDVIGQGNDNLFDMRVNLRYGCTILRHYLDIEKGDLFRALGRYNGSTGKPEYPNLVKGAWQRWEVAPTQLAYNTTASASTIPTTMPPVTPSLTSSSANKPTTSVNVLSVVR